VVEAVFSKVYLLGNFRLVNCGKTVDGLRKRSQQLLAYLILHRQAPQSRRRIAEALWPETQTSQALTNLRKELHHLRQTDAPIKQLLAISAKTLHWHPQIPCDVDIVCFETTLATAKSAEDKDAVLALETALSIWQGELWSDCDADWIYPEQVRVRQSYVRAIAQITQLLQSLGNIDKAITFGQRWLQADPLDEGATQCLMRLYGDAGDRATALRLYHQCMSRLQTELGVNPSPTTAAIYQQLLMAESDFTEIHPSTLAKPPSLPIATSISSEMIGRNTLFQHLENWLLLPMNSSAPLLLLTGEPGIGKTRLLEALAKSALQHQFQVCWGGAFAAEQLRAYGVWIDLLRTAPSDWSEALSVLLSEKGRAKIDNRGQILDIVVQCIDKQTHPQQPMLLLFDDIHWLDESSATLLHYVFRLLGRGSLRIVCAARSAELQDNLAALTLVKSLRRENRLRDIAVPPLSAESVLALVKSLQTENRIESVNIQQLYIDSGGNPLFALEAMRANEPNNSNSQEHSSLSSLIEDRLQRLDGAARDLLPWAAALGHRFNPEILALAASYPPMSFLTAIEQLEQQHIVRSAPSGCGDEQVSQEQSHYDFVHDIVRQVAYDQLSTPRRRIVHGQLAATLKTQMVDDDLASQVAYHAGLAGKHALAAEAYAAGAARSLRLFAYEETVQLVAEGLSHCQYLPSHKRLLYAAQLWRSRILAGVPVTDVSEIEQQLQQLLADMNGLKLVEAEIVAHQALAYLNYDKDNINATHQQCLASLGFVPKVPRLQAETLATNGGCLAAIGRDMERAESLLLEAQALANRLGLSLSDIDLGLGCVYRYRGDYDLALTHLQQALQLSNNQQDYIQAGCCLSYLAMTAWDNHQPQREYAHALLNLSPQLPQGSDAAFAQSLLALQNYAEELDDTTETSVTYSLQHLDQLDAQRKTAFVASHAAETARKNGDMECARAFALRACQSAKTVKHPDDVAISEALCLLTTESSERVESHWQTLESVNLSSVSARTQYLIIQAEQIMLPLKKTLER